MKMSFNVCLFGNFIPARLNVGVMLFFSCLFLNMLSSQMSINLLAMVQPTSLKYDNGTLIKATDYGPRYNWSAYDQSLLLGAFYWGYAITSIPCGILSARSSSRMLLTYSFSLCALVTALVPLGASLSYWMIFCLRLILGVFLSVVYPTLHKLISHWAPPHERGKFVSAMFGAAIGIAVAFPMAGFLIESVGWVYAFYVPAVMVVIFTFALHLIVFDSPARHPRITTQEKDYIESHLKGLSIEKSWPPMFSIARSVPFWALLILHYGNLWGNLFLVTGAPKYMNEVLGFNLSSTGVLATLPSLSRCIFGIIFGCVGDWMHRNKCMSLTNLRKFFCLFSHIIPGLFMIGMIFINDRPYFCITFMTASLGFNGAAAMTNLLNSQDLSPNYAGTLYSIINTAGTTAGFLAPILIAFFTKESNTTADWNYLFIISGGFYLVTALVFLLFGTGDTQKWNTIAIKPADMNDNEIRIRSYLAIA